MSEHDHEGHSGTAVLGEMFEPANWHEHYSGEGTPPPGMPSRHPLA